MSDTNPPPAPSPEGKPYRFRRLTTGHYAIDRLSDFKFLGCVRQQMERPWGSRAAQPRWWLKDATGTLIPRSRMGTGFRSRDDAAKELLRLAALSAPAAGKNHEED